MAPPRKQAVPLADGSFGLVCSRCHQLKPSSEFHRSKHGCGYSPACKACVSEWGKGYRERNREILNQKHREWREANPEKQAACAKTWRDANTERLIAYRFQRNHADPDTARARWKTDYQRNAGKRRAKMRERRSAQPERMLAAQRKYRQKHPERHTANQQAREARKKQVLIDYVDPMVVYERDRWKCGICGRPVEREEASIDHIWPLSKGGMHSYQNVQCAHKRCNSRKCASGYGQLRLMGVMS